MRLKKKASIAAASSGGSRTKGNASVSADVYSINLQNDKISEGNNNSVYENYSTSRGITSCLASAVTAGAQSAAKGAAASQQQRHQSLNLNTFTSQQPYAYYILAQNCKSIDLEYTL
ncbi:unnamed protein product [Lepeophtheirus salmonis]|uniref:(salmon louse) hypothetical protein n=1 Tax=Lepeophtheirus salmonis TaxID=72036 RepID=A0A7R8D0M7_LEPSM|nr:unnamed protein product [Lepeophtheirus salmonis]CAF2985814.1 unnamed protein product [Lepeophtheirus salmonis]